jgi:uncharacterized OB-fold protein
VRLPWQPPDMEQAKPFWDAAARGVLAAPWCLHCDAPVLYPRDFCPRCHGTSIEWRELSGRGTVYSYAVETRALPGVDLEPPFVIALVDLDEGGRLPTNILAPPDAVAVGDAVEVTFTTIDDGRHVPRFRPVA